MTRASVQASAGIRDANEPAEGNSAQKVLRLIGLLN